MVRLLLTALFLTPPPLLAQWTRVDGIPAGESYAVISAGDTLYVSVDSTVYISMDQGGTWEQTSPISGVEAPISALLRLPSGLVAGTLFEGVFTTSDGVTWTEHSRGLEGLGAQSIYALAIRDTMMYAGTLGGGVFRTGVSLVSPWSPFNQGIPSNLGWNINSLTNLSDTLWAGGGSNAIVYRNGPLDNVWESIAFASFSQQGTAFLAATEYRSKMHAIGSQGLHRTTDGGTTWTEFDPGAGFLATGGFTQTPDGLHAFLGKPGATYLLKLDDDDSSWTQVDVSAGATYAMAASGNTLFGGRTDGLWKYDLVPSSVDGDPRLVHTRELVLDQNYPNPFNPTSEIGYQTADAGRVRLAVYDLLGREVAVLVDALQPAGSYRVTFDARDLSGGMYVYRLSTGPRAESRTMVLLK